MNKKNKAPQSSIDYFTAHKKLSQHPGIKKQSKFVEKLAEGAQKLPNTVIAPLIDVRKLTKIDDEKLAENRASKHSAFLTCPAVSPQILRQTLYRMDKQKKQLNVLARNERLSSGSSGFPDWTSAGSTSSSVDSPLLGTRFGFMEGKISKFQLKRLKIKQQTLLENCAWKSVENFTWKSTQDREVILTGKRLAFLSSVEKLAVEKIAINRLQKMNLGCSIVKPKEGLPLRQRRMKYNRRKAQTVNVIDKKKFSDTKLPMATPGTTPQGPSQQVFGVPLSQCVEFERGVAARPRRPTDSHKRSADEVLCPSFGAFSARGPSGVAAPSRHSTLRPVQKFSDSEIMKTSFSYNNPSASMEEQLDAFNVDLCPAARLCDQMTRASLSDQASEETAAMYSPRLAYSSKSSLCTSQEDSPSLEKQYFSNDSLFGISPNSKSDSSLCKQENSEIELKRVPRIVQTCTDYLMEHGLHTVGIFRVAGSAKRCRQLRLELDSGQEVVFMDDEQDLYPHDVATLLKEYFRDLPDPLLTRELYPCYVAAAKLPDQGLIEALRYLTYLLPVANCDTFFVLLQFLNQVSNFSDDKITEEGVRISGNKMNVKNLATVFGPTILRPGGLALKMSQSLSENESLIRVVQAMIEECGNLFFVTKDVQDQAYKYLQETDPDSLDAILANLLNEGSGTGNSEMEKAGQSAVFVTTERKTSPDVVTREADGSTVITTREHTTHRIVYRMGGTGPSPDWSSGPLDPLANLSHRMPQDESADDATSGLGSSLASTSNCTSDVYSAGPLFKPNDAKIKFFGDSRAADFEFSSPMFKQGCQGLREHDLMAREANFEASSLSSAHSEPISPTRHKTEPMFNSRPEMVGSGTISKQKFLNATRSSEQLNVSLDPITDSCLTVVSPFRQRKNAMKDPPKAVNLVPTRKITPMAKWAEAIRFGSRR